MTKSIRTPATYADLEKVPPHLVAEIIDGVLETHPRPLPRHGVAANALGFEITGPFQKGRGGPGGWVFIIEPELHLGQNVLVPDLAGWRRERLPTLPPKVGIATAPDWVCEVLSPSTERLDRTRKRAIYSQYGVQYLWFLNPDKRVIEAFELRGDVWALVATASGGEPVSLPPFAAISFPMDDLFPLDPPFSEDSEG